MQEPSAELTGRGAPLVDVGVPVWGHSPYLEEAVASVESQTLRSWRLHISQDGRREASVENLLASRIRDPRIVYSATDQPAGAPRNKTCLIRSGEARYVALLDHDDVWGPDFLRRRVAFLDANPACAYVFSPTVIVDGAGRVLRHTPRLLADGVHVREQFVPRLLRLAGIPGGSVVVRRSAYQQVGDEFCDALRRTYDYEMWVRLALRYPVGYLGVWDTSWRLHENNASLTDLQGYDEECELLVSRLSRIVVREQPDLLLGREVWRRKVSSLLLTASLDALEFGERRTAWHYLLRALRRDRLRALDPRTLPILVGVALGGRGAVFIPGVRGVRHRARRTDRR